MQLGLNRYLTYQYDPYETSYNPSNKLYKVTDASDLTRGFKSANQTFSYNYNYDVNGNLIWDANKNISNIDYNHLNLPTVITFVGNKTITFLYDAGGNKLRKTVVDNGVTLYVQDYVGGIEYRNNVLESIFHSEGRVTNISGSLKYEYALKDHLGNTRLMFTDKSGDGIVQQLSSLPESNSNEVTQENHYYAFGMNMEHVWVNNIPIVDNRYQYNGKELNEDFGLNWNDYGFRFYDAAVGRWNAVDPMADAYQAFSPYAYVMNNPIRLIDPNGMYSADPTASRNTGIVTPDGIVGGASTEKKGGIFISEDTGKKDKNGTSFFKRFEWTPNMEYTGGDEAAKLTVLALNSNYNAAVKQGMGNINWSRIGKSGNVLLDFLPGGQLSNVELLICPVTGNPATATSSESSHFDDVGFNSKGSSTLYFNPYQALKYDNFRTQIAGNHSPATIMMHELTHAWMRNMNNILSENMANFLSKNGEGSHFEMVAMQLENAAAKIRGENGTRVYHQGNNSFYKVNNPLSTK